MKKAVSILILFVLSAVALTGCSNNAEPFEQKSYTADISQVQSIQIDVRDRTIEVTQSNDGQIHIVYSENSRERYEISVSDGHVLTMTAANKKEWTDYVGGKPADEDRRISLQVPNNLLDSLTISTTNENISLQPLTVSKDISLASNGGNITFDKLNAGNATILDAKNGNITGSISGRYEDYAITCEIKKGESNLPADKGKGTKRLQVNGNNGDIDIEFINE